MVKSESINVPGTINIVQAYDAMVIFIKNYLDRQMPDEMIDGPGLLGTMMRDQMGDGLPIDLLNWNDWLESVRLTVNK